MLLLRCLLLTSSLCALTLLTGCALETTALPGAEKGVAMQGKVQGGNQPVIGAKVFLLQANTTGYGGAGIAAASANASQSLLTVGTVDTSTGATNGFRYVTTDSQGNFSITGDYTCTANSQVYLYVAGGNTGSGTNSSAGFLSVLGTCPSSLNFLSSVPFLYVNEVTTIAAAYAFAGFATDALHVSNSGTTLSATGMANAFANFGSLVNVTTGVAYAQNPHNSNGTVPQSEINTLSNILAACVNSTDTQPDNCNNLFSYVQSAGTGGTTAADTATEAIYIAQHPGVAVSSLYALQAASVPFQPSLTAAPNDFSLGLVFTGGGINMTNSMAVDAMGNLWSINDSSFVTEISSAGVFLSGPNGYLSGAYAAGPIALDLDGNVWIGGGAHTYSGPGNVVEMSNTGAVLSGANGYGYGLLRTPEGLAVDANNNIWVADSVSNNVVELSNSGQVLSGTGGYTGGGISNPNQLAITSSDNIWVTNSTAPSISALSNSGAPTTPSSGVTGASFVGGASLAIDHQNNIWTVGAGPGAQVSKVSPNGVILSGSGYATIGVGGAHAGGTTIAIDGDGNPWVPLYFSPFVIELSNSGAILSGSTGYSGGVGIGPANIVIDGSGDVWVSNATYTPSPERGVAGFYTWRITEMIGVAAPVVTPIAAGVQGNMLGARP